MIVSGAGVIFPEVIPVPAVPWLAVKPLNGVNKANRFASAPPSE
jgi:hypothetical protein